MKESLANLYSENETKFDLGFFIAGIAFDALTLGSLDNPIVILQQIIYLSIVGLLLWADFLNQKGLWAPGDLISRFWKFREMVIHFFMGSLLSLYSLFFLKSASVFASFIFLTAMGALMVANELKAVQRRGLDLKVGLYFVCVFSFFSMMTPLVFGFVGWIPFLTAWAVFLLFTMGVHWLLRKRVAEHSSVNRTVLWPGGSVATVFLGFYLMGWIPPVPLSVQHFGVYHLVEKVDGQYVLHHENPWWRFWLTGDQDFLAAPGDQIYVFARIFSPARISDAVTLHWQVYNEKKGWMTTDRIPMKITGGRKEGFRGVASKRNYDSGDWRILIETTDGREIGRLRFWVTKMPDAPEERIFEREIH